MDRIAPTKRPEGQPAGYQQWKDLLFVHWPVPTGAVRALVPERLSLDLYEGQAYVGVVPFEMRGVRPWWAPGWSAFNFLEANVRTYVHLDGGGPGVYFLSLEAASWIAVQAARAGWGLPYHHAQMSMTRRDDGFVYETTRRCGARPRLRANWTPGEPQGPSEPGSFEFFLLERYLLYAEHRGQLRCGQVHHTPYPARRVEVTRFEDQLVEAAGLPGCPEELPPIAHCSDGVDVGIFALKRV